MSDYFKVGTFDEKSWHGKEKPLTHNNIWRAMQDVQMDRIRFEKLQSYAFWDGEYLPIDDKYQLVMVNAPWAPNKVLPFGRQVASYEPLQHEFMAQLLQPIIDMSGGGVKLKGVAVVGAKGEISYIQLDLGEFYVADDPDEGHKSFLLLADNKMKSATHWLHTTIRVVCWNTYSAAVDKVPPIPHGSTGQMLLNFHVALLERAIRAKDEECARLNAFFRKVVNREQIKDAINVVFADPPLTPAQRAAQQVKGDTDDPRIVAVLEQAEADTARLASQFELAAKRRQEMLLAVEQFNDEKPRAANTVYAFWQAATGVISHSDTFTGDPWKQTISQLFLGGQKNTMLQLAASEARKMMVGK